MPIKKLSLANINLDSLAQEPRLEPSLKSLQMHGHGARSWEKTEVLRESRQHLGCVVAFGRGDDHRGWMD